MNENNLDATKELCEEITVFTGLRSAHSLNFCRTVVDTLIHRIAEESLDSDGSSESREYTMNLPMIGTLTLECTNNSVSIKSLKLDGNFKKKVLKAHNKGTSPLVERAKTSISKTINNRYQSLL